MQPSLSRFVIHRHITDPLHYDLMIEIENGLATWSFQVQPRDTSLFPLDSQKIQDHRLCYLEYEGPISKDRGRVEIVDRGPIQIVRRSPQTWTLHFRGVHLSGDCLLQQIEGNHWTLDRKPTHA